MLLENVLDPRPEYIRDVCDGVDDPRLRICLDVGHANAYSEVPVEDWIAMLGGRIAHVHLKDSPPGDGRKRVSVGTGAVPNAEIVRTVAAQGYDGWYTLEDLIGKDRLPDVRQQIARIRRWVDEGRPAR